MVNMTKVCAIATLTLTSFSTAWAQDPASCKKVRFSEIGWTDIAATTAIASTVFDGLGYHSTQTISSIPITFVGLKKKQIDVFLGNWKPAMDSVVAPFVESGAVKVLEHPNLEGAKFTLAVPKYVHEAGLKSFADISKFGDKLQYQIYGLASGGAGNIKILDMIEKDQFGLKNFKLVESSEAGMLVAVNRAVRENRWVVFLGWEPHPMNLDIEMAYLDGGDDVFGPNYGEATVWSVTSSDYSERCPNAAKFVENLKFTTDIESQVMKSIMDDGKKPMAAAKEWLKNNPDILAQWLSGVKTLDGQEGLPVVASYLDAE
jgi:glycine betaine/proline transport system substrate-binding protein